MQLHYKRLPSNECWALCVFVCFSIELDFLFYVCKLIILNVVNRLAKILLKTLGLTAVSSAAEAGIQKKKMFGSKITTSVISNEEMENILKIVKSLKDSSLLIKVVGRKIDS